MQGLPSILSLLGNEFNKFDKDYSRKKYLGGGVGGGGGKEGKRYIFLWVVGADIFQIKWVIGV